MIPASAGYVLRADEHGRSYSELVSKEALFERHLNLLTYAWVP
jgi:hypothetical protein